MTSRIHRLKMLRVILISAAIAVFGCATVSAQASRAPGWKIADFKLPKLKWGLQEITAPVTNNSDEFRILVVSASVISRERPGSVPRVTKRSRYFEPGETANIALAIDVPENFSTTKVTVAFHQVVDTLDDLSFGKKIFEKELLDSVTSPPALASYRSNMPRLSGWSGRNDAINTDLAMIVSLMLGRGMSYDSVMALCDISRDRLLALGRRLTDRGFAKLENSVYRPTFQLIEPSRAAAFAPSLDSASAALTAALTQAIPVYQSRRQELIASGRVTADPNDVMEGTALLHHLYPVVGGVVLWERLAPSILNDTGAFLNMFGQRSPCDACMGEYGYMLTSHDIPDGSTFYFRDNATRRSVFADNPEALTCVQKSYSANPSERFAFPVGKTPVVFYYNSARCDSAISALLAPCQIVRDEWMGKISKRYAPDHEKLSRAERLWVWNSIVTESLRQLTASKVVEDHKGEYFLWLAS